MTLDKFRVTVFSILRKNILALSICGLFPFAVGLRMRDGRLVPYTSWPTLVRYAVLIPGLYFSILLVVTVVQDVVDAKRERAASRVFGGIIGYQLLLLGGVAFFVGLDIWANSPSSHVTITDVVFPAGMALLAFWGWPRPIEISKGALFQRKMLGGVKSILFSDILAAKFDARQHSIIITGKTGVRIVHSMFHARQGQFAHLLEQLTGTPVIGLNT
jgi:hypothetical protein